MLHDSEYDEWRSRKNSGTRERDLRVEEDDEGKREEKKLQYECQ